MKSSPLQTRGRGRRLILPLLLFAVLTVSLDAQEDFARRVAVLDFEAVGVSRDLAIEAQNAVERALYEVRGLQLIERGKIDLILREQEMQLSDLADQDTAVEVGRLLAANTVVTGVVTRPEDPRLTVKILDVETGAVLFVGERSGWSKEPNRHGGPQAGSGCREDPVPRAIRTAALVPGRLCPDGGPFHRFG